ncbi:MAG: hypothetical protein KC583_16635 [Myxococcales bacterium]|nr:hypothetical protein [Myxococcales bacterium]
MTTPRQDQTQTFRCAHCRQRLGGLEGAKAALPGAPATGAATGRFLRFENGRVYARCRCGKETGLPLEIRVTFNA